MSEPAISIAYAALRGRCPRCGRGKLYRGLLTVVDQCSVCGLPLKAHEQGDGPAFFAVLIVGALAAIGAAITEIKYEPPFWVHAAIWLPFVVIATLLSLRWLKGALIAIQYQYRQHDFGSDA